LSNAINLLYNERIALSDIVTKALENAKVSQEYWRDIYDKSRADLHFLSDDKYAQWDEQDYNARTKSGRPALTIDQVSQFVNQVSNDIRQNTPSIEILPYSGGADIDTAEIYQGLIRNIEYESDADSAYDNAVNFAIRCGIGFIRVDHDYIDEDSFEQRLFVDRIINPFSVLFDEDSVKQDGSDAKKCTILEKISIDRFKEEYPDFDPNSFEVTGQSCTDEDYIIIAECFKIEEEDVYLIEGEDGEVIKSDTKPNKDVRSRKSTKRIVRRYKLSGTDVLEGGIFPGEFIPVVPVYGEEAWMDGQRNLISLVRRSKDSQRMYNYWASLETELLMKAPKAPVVAVGGSIEAYADDWLNPDKAQVLRYDQTDEGGMPYNPPQITPPIQIPAGIVNARQQTTQDIRATMGLYDSYLGQQDNAISGVAIQARQGEGNRAVFHYSDNLIRSITQVGRICVSAIPVVYDTPRIVRIIGKEDTNDEVGINGAYVEGQEKNHSLGMGKFSVKVSTGASYSTMRQEASRAYQDIVGAQPQLMSVMGDLLFKYMDFPGAQALSERMKRTIDPALLEDNSEDPQVMAMQKQNQELQQGIEMLQGQLGQLQEQLNNKQAEIEIKAQAEMNDAQTDDKKHRLDISKLRLEEQKIAAELEIKRQELELRAYELGFKTESAANEQRNKALNEFTELPVNVDVTPEGLQGV